MKNKILFPAVLLLALIGGGVLLHLSASLSDNDEINNAVNTHLLEIEYLNSKLNQLVLKSRLNIDANYDELAKTTNAISDQIIQLSDTYFSQNKITGSLLEERFNEFKEAVVAKVDYIENFKSVNSVLRNSDRYVPVVGKELIQISNQEGLEENAQLYEDIIIDTVLFTKQDQGLEGTLDAKAYSELIEKTEGVMPPDSLIKLIELSNHILTLEQSKKDTQSYMEKSISAVSNAGIQEIQTAWNQLQAKNNKVQSLLRYYAIAYVIIMLALICWLTYRLRNSYKSLDNEVKRKTDEVKTAYESLRASERRLAQSQKMASIGQLITGVANQVNTPLAYASSNVGVVKSKLALLLPIYESVRKMADTIISKQYDSALIRSLLTQQVSAYSKTKEIQPDNLVNLLNDSSEGLNDIQETVKLLTSYSDIDEKRFDSIQVDSIVKQALKVCKPNLGKRKIVCEFSEQPIMVKGISNQLTQVMVNLLNNAVDATKNTGLISIKMFNQNDNAILKISDNGHGIEQSILEKVLDPFFTTRDVGEGAGLGLTICNQIIAAHHGELNIESDPSVGTSIIVKLPRPRSMPDPQQDDIDDIEMDVAFNSFALNRNVS